MKPITSRNIGCVIDASSDSATSLNLQTIALARQYGAKLGRLPAKRSEDYDQIVSEMADSAVDHLNGLELPSFCSFVFEDNSLFLSPSVESAREDCGFVSVSDRSSAQFKADRDCDPEDAARPCATYRGEWLHVNDHGNCTLYVRESVNPVAFEKLATHRADLRDVETLIALFDGEDHNVETLRGYDLTPETLPAYLAQLRSQATVAQANIDHALAYTDREVWSVV